MEQPSLFLLSVIMLVLWGTLIGGTVGVTVYLWPGRTTRMNALKGALAGVMASSVAALVLFLLLTEFDNYTKSINQKKREKVKMAIEECKKHVTWREEPHIYRRVKSVITEVLSVDTSQTNPESSFINDLGADSDRS